MIKVAIFAFAILFLTILYDDNANRDRPVERCTAIFMGALIGILVSAFVFPVKACHQLTPKLQESISFLHDVNHKINNFYMSSKNDCNDREDAGQEIIEKSRSIIDLFGDILKDVANSKGEVFQLWKSPRQYPTEEFEKAFQSCRRMFYIFMAQYHGVRFNTGTCHYCQIFQGDMLDLSSIVLGNALTIISETYKQNLFTGCHINACSTVVDGLSKDTFQECMREQLELLQECLDLLTYQHRYNMEKGYDCQFGMGDLENYYLYFNNMKLLRVHLEALVEGTVLLRSALLGKSFELKEDNEFTCTISDD